jgi:uncharacterized repeat protein (TIGR01451 family)
VKKTQKQVITTKTFIPLLLITLALLISLSTVSANEIYVNTTGNDTSGTGTSDNPYLTIQTGIDNLDPDGTIRIANGQYSGVNNTNITISKNLNIIGQSQENTIINGTNTNWIFKILTGVNVTICNLTLANGDSINSGGAIQNQGKLTVNDSTFTSNFADSGGAIWNQGDLILNNSTFTKNTANVAGAIRNENTLTVTDCTFTNNSAIFSNCGTIFNILSLDGFSTGSLYCTVTNSTFTSNSAEESGGAIWNSCSVSGHASGTVICNITKCSFTGNTANNYGGAICNSCLVYGTGTGTVNCNVTECSFISNKAETYGGAISNRLAGSGTGSSICTANFNRFFNNTATTSGNAIYNNGGSVDAENNWWGINNPDNDWSQFLDGVTSPTMWVQLTINATPDVLCVGETSTVTANLNYNNVGQDLMATYGKSIPQVEVLFDVDSLGTLNTYNGIISNGNNATTIFTAGQMPGISTVNATVDKATVDKSITIQREDVYVATSTDGGNDSNNGSADSPFLTLQKAIEVLQTGGRIHIANGEYKGAKNRGLTINKNMTIFQDNWIPGTGTSVIINAENQDRIFNINPEITVIINNLTLTNGGSNIFGGAIRNKGNLTVSNCTFINNLAEYGGAIANYFGTTDGAIGSANCTVTGCNFTNNQAYYDGGAINNYCIILFSGSGSGTVNCTVTGCNFTNNQAGRDGGAIINYGNVFAGGSGSVNCTVTGCNFTNNQADNDGGAISNYCYLVWDSCSVDCTVTGCNFSNNHADSDGGAIFNYCEILAGTGLSTCTANFNRFFNNTATTSGNAIYNNGGSVDAENNWWGINNPDNDWSQFLDGVTSPTMWVQLTINATPDVLCVGETSTVTANLNYNNVGQDLMATYGKSIPQVEVLFDVDSLGTLNTYNGIISNGNNATTIFTAGQMPGISTVNATVDKATVDKSITIQREDVYVATSTDGGNDSNNGSADSPFLTLQKAIEVLQTGGRIHIANGEYNDPLDRGLILDKNMTILRDNWIPGTGTSVIINADSNGGIFFIDPGATVAFQNLTMVNGTSFDGFGGAILNLGTLNVLNCGFSDNKADYYGGAIYNYGDLNVSNSIFTENSVSDWSEYFVGGAICNMANMNVTNCTFTNNTAGTGGAISSQTDPGYTMIVTGNVFTENSATNYGGAFYIYNGDYTSNIIHFNRIIGNTALQGDGIYTDHGSVNATLNWWGSNNDPSTILNLFVAVNDGSVLSDPWIILRVFANQTSVYNSQNAKVTASMLYDSGFLTDPNNPNLYYHDPQYGHVPDGTVQLDIYDWGSFNTGTQSINLNTLNGSADTTFFADGGQPTPSSVTINGTVDGYTTLGVASALLNIIKAADLNITKTANVTTANVGDLVQYTITAHNNGPDDATGLEIVDILPTGLDFVSASDGGIYDALSRTITWTIGTLANGNDVIRTFNATVNVDMVGSNIINVVNETHTEYPNNSTTNCTIYVPKANLYIEITSDKDNPTVGEKFTVTYKLGNKGPDDALNVSVIIPIPEGFHVLRIYGDGNWTVNANGTITWTFTNVAVGDPYLHLYGYASGEGDILFTASIFSDTYNANTIGVNSLTIQILPEETSQVNAATTETTVGMQNTGIPLPGMVLAILMVLGGLISTRKKQ